MDPYTKKWKFTQALEKMQKFAVEWAFFLSGESGAYDFVTQEG